MGKIIICYGIGFITLILVNLIGRRLTKETRKLSLNLYDVFHGITPEMKRFFLSLCPEISKP